MVVVLYGSSGFDTTAACSSLGGRCEPWLGNNASVVPFRQYATARIAYPTSPAPDIMIRDNQVSSTWGAADARN